MKKTYAHHTPTPQAIAKIRSLRAACSDLHDKIASTAPNSREQSLALTRLEEVAMWAIKAVVCNDPESVVEA